ncbi:MAG: hypothetical protein JST16_11540 [Bdellovibrionales bacterium]|nr:hypothetical protein [Bdellovibrionales bacterium]
MQKTALRLLGTLLLVATYLPTRPSYAGGFFLDFPLIGVGTFRSANVNDTLAANGFAKKSDFTYIGYTQGTLGYEWAGGFRVAVNALVRTPIEHTEGPAFVALESKGGSLSAEYAIVGGGTFHQIFAGVGLGGTMTRFTIYGNNNWGIAQDTSWFVDPTLSYEYGGNSIRLKWSLGYAKTSDVEFKSYGMPGVTRLYEDSLHTHLSLMVFL